MTLLMWVGDISLSGLLIIRLSPFFQQKNDPSSYLTMDFYYNIVIYPKTPPLEWAKNDFFILFFLKLMNGKILLLYLGELSLCPSPPPTPFVSNDENGLLLTYQLITDNVNYIVSPTDIWRQHQVKQDNIKSRTWSPKHSCEALSTEHQTGSANSIESEKAPNFLNEI